MNINPYEFEKAKDGSLFIKKGGKLVATSFDELAKDLKAEIKNVPNLEQKVNATIKVLANFKKLVKRHFIVVFTLFKLKAMSGEIEIEDDLLILDEKVLNDEMTIKEALNKHEFLKNTFDALYGNEFDELSNLGGK